MNYTLDHFNYDLPKELIAQTPVTPRDHSRLLIYERRSGIITDDYFYNIGNYLPQNTSLVVNNSKVEKCRLLFNDGKIELFITKTIKHRVAEAMVRPGKKFKEGKTIPLTDQLTVKTISTSEDGIRTIELSHSLNDPIFQPYRNTPFPPYIESDESLSDRYQTVFAKDEGSKAAPTAGLHFTPEL